ncbi:unnamed protein product [Cyprideis torosa]|uniref:Uncharacterized protein n=1 Tax=Cyprideis torosa TaxID=163714 RepID=A0A7R8W4J7_9CRUS|nr:unnamed protein product [Cyprideis torosa]CAG0879608.1 unnamed protein product [Cyprideis torosa]
MKDILGNGSRAKFLSRTCAFIPGVCWAHGIWFKGNLDRECTGGLGRNDDYAMGRKELSDLAFLRQYPNAHADGSAGNAWKTTQEVPVKDPHQPPQEHSGGDPCQTNPGEVFATDLRSVRRVRLDCKDCHIEWTEKNGVQSVMQIVFCPGNRQWLGKTCVYVDPVFM